MPCRFGKRWRIIYFFGALSHYGFCLGLERKLALVIRCGRAMIGVPRALALFDIQQYLVSILIAYPCMLYLAQKDLQISRPTESWVNICVLDSTDLLVPVA